MNFSIVVPVYNEKGNIDELYRELKEKAKDAHEFVFVDDGSNDGTAGLLASLASKDPLVKLVTFRRRYGQTAALAAGFAAASGEWIVTLDGDLQNDPADIPRLLEKAAQGFDVVSGWRRDRKDRFLSRRLPSSAANRLISFLTGVALHDHGCTLKAYRRIFVQDLRLYGEMHRFLPAYLAWNGARLAEVEVAHRPRRHGRSKYGLERVFKVILDLLVARYFFSYLTKPIYVFGGVALGATALAALVAALVIARKLYFGGEWISPLIFVSFFLAGVAVLSLLMGFLAEVLVRIYFETRNRAAYQIK
ncbi:MAG: glycosyltransferase family 2 protein [Endomicrobiales bacterium]